MSSLVKSFISFTGFNPISFAFSMLASAVLSKLLAPNIPNQAAQQIEPNPGNRAQTPPAGNNKLPVLYGKGWTGGIITDLSITSDNQTLYYVFTLSEVTNTEAGVSVGAADNITFGDVYWGGKKCIFDTTDLTKVVSLQDTSTNESQDVNGYLNVYLYKNGSNAPANTSDSAITIMSDPALTYRWDNSKLMTNCAFAIIKIKFSQSRNLVGLAGTNFQLTNARSAPGDCFLDYLTSTRYGASIPLASINTASLTALNSYSNAPMGYTTWEGGSSNQSRFAFNGALDTAQKIMKNIQSMADCCDCLVKYNEITGLWGVIVQSPTYTVAMQINDSNLVGPIAVSPIDISNSFNIIECKFPDSDQQDSFNASTFDLAQLNPSLLFPNEPVNKQSVSLYLTNNNVTAQYLANRMLEAAREDLQIQCEINYYGLELEAGDIVTLTNANYGWSAKLFRIMKVIEKFGDDGTITASLSLLEFNPQVYDDKNVTQFTPSPNSGLPSPITFGVVYPPIVIAEYPTITNPSFTLRIQTSSAGISNYAEIYYSAYQFPTDAQLIFAGTTETQPAGVPYVNNSYMPDVQLFNIPAGDWYFFVRMVNSLASSNYSPASDVLEWRPSTFQYQYQYLCVAYADDITGSTNFSFSPTNRLYYGLYNPVDSDPPSLPTPPNDASLYKWYLADPDFSTNRYLVYINRTGRKFSFDTYFADYAAGTGAFVPTSTAQFDPRLWAALPDGENVINLDTGTGQVVKIGNRFSSGQLAVSNLPDGQLFVGLDQFLDFGGPTTFTGAASTVTIDIYGRVVGFTTPDNFYMTTTNFTATSGQTVFSVSRDASYIVGQCLVFSNGVLLNASEYTDAASTVTLGTGATTGTKITVISFRAISTQAFYANSNLIVSNVASNVVTWNSSTMPYQNIEAGDLMTFANTGSPTTYTVSSVNYTTRQITFTGAVTASVGNQIYTYRAAGSSYRVFSRYEADLTSASIYTPTLWNFESGYETPYINGIALTDPDYDIVSGSFTNLPSTSTGRLSIIQFTSDNTTTPVGTLQNVVTYMVNGQINYSFPFVTSGLNLYGNGVMLVNAVDYTESTNLYALTTAYTTSVGVLLQQSLARAGAA
jgi:hypothetical protein